MEQQVANQQGGWTPSSQTSFSYKRRRLRKKASQIALKMEEKAVRMVRND
jgi:hypothetical protein